MEWIVIFTLNIHLDTDLQSWPIYNGHIFECQLQLTFFSETNYFTFVGHLNKIGLFLSWKCILVGLFARKMKYLSISIRSHPFVIKSSTFEDFKNKNCIVEYFIFLLALCFLLQDCERF